VRGQLVGLRELRPDDVGERYLAWMRDPGVIQYLESRFTEQTLDTLREFVCGASARVDTLLLAIIELATEGHVGNIKVGPVNPHHRTADVGLLIGERGVWGRGYATEAIRLATPVSFDRLGVRKLTASCYSDNVGSAAAFRRAGWMDEGRRPAQFLTDDGRVQDQLLFGILAPGQQPPGVV